MTTLSKLTNEGTIDRGLRIGLGVALIAVALFTYWWVALIGLIPLATGLVGFCPLYRLIGIDTCGKEGCTKQTPAA